MIRLDEEALYCDLAQTYHIFDWEEVPFGRLATLAAGLGPSARIMRKLLGLPADPLEVILYGIVDRLNLLVYAQTKDAIKGRNYPKSIVDGLFPKEEFAGFSSVEAFEKARQQIIEKGR